MPDGHDTSFRRLVAASAAYRKRYGEWPYEAWMEPGLLWELARFLDAQSFEALGDRLTLRTKAASGLSVGGPRGVRVYDGSDWDLAGEELLRLSERWLNVEPLRLRDGPEPI